VLDLEREYHDRLGTQTRRVAYSHLLQDVPLLFECFEDNCGPRQTKLLRLMWPQARGESAAAVAAQRQRAGAGMLQRALPFHSPCTPLTPTRGFRAPASVAARDVLRPRLRALPTPALCSVEVTAGVVWGWRFCCLRGDGVARTAHNFR